MTAHDTRHPVIADLAALGPRPAGEPAEHAAADYLAGVFSGLGLEPKIERFTFTGWEQTRPARVEILAPERIELAAGPMAYSDSTPPEGVSGRLVRTGTARLCPGLFEWPEFALLDDAGEEVAWLLARAGGGPIPMPSTYPDARLTRVVANIGEADGERIDRWLEAGHEVRATIATAGRLVPGLRSQNVIATLPGKSAEEIVVSCHLDTAPGAPGAIDNASGAQCMVDLAAALAAGPQPEKTFTFVGFGAEEYFLLGSIHHVSRRSTRGTLGRVVANLNIDTVGKGDTLMALVDSHAMRELIVQALADSGGAGFFAAEVFADPKEAADNYPFHEAGIPNCALVVWPYDEYHLPADDLALVDHDVVDRVSALVESLARALDGVDPATLRAR